MTDPVIAHSKYSSSNNTSVLDYNSCIIAIVGGSGSGKTTIAQRILQCLPLSSCQILSQDNYYKDQSQSFHGDGSINFDHPDAIDFSLMEQHLSKLKKGLSIQSPLYDFATHTRKKETKTVNATPFIIVDGTLILTSDLVRKLFDVSIFLDIPENIRFARRLKRDICERGRTEEGVRKQFFSLVKPMHDEFISPCKKNAQFIFTDNLDIDIFILEVKKYIYSKFFIAE